MRRSRNPDADVVSKGGCKGMHLSYTGEWTMLGHRPGFTWTWATCLHNVVDRGSLSGAKVTDE